MTADTSQPGRLGTAVRAEGRYVLRYERLLGHPIERVWDALTSPNELAGWLAAADELELVEGGRIALRWLNVPEDVGAWEKQGIENAEAAGVIARGTITRLDPPNLIEYETDQMGRMRWELRPADSGCSLIFTNVVALPEDHPPEQTLAGWHIHLDHLEEALAGHPVEWSTWTEDHLGTWAGIRDRYAVRALYAALLERWNDRDAAGYAALVHDDGHVVGFDGSEMNGSAEIEAALGAIFSDHETARYVAIVRDVRALSEDVAVLRAVVGMIPPGASDLNPDANAVQTLVARREGDVWRVAVFQNTPAAYHGRPEASERLTEELRRSALVEADPPAAVVPDPD